VATGLRTSNLIGEDVTRVLLLRGTIGAGKSCVARWIGASRPKVKVIEVDDIKARKYGATDRCDETVDFPEAGRMANEEILAGHDVIVVEAFCDRRHLEWVLGPMNLRLKSPGVGAAWLECDLGTSFARKTHALSREVIQFQHQRRESRFRLLTEPVVSTDALTVEQVARRVLAATPFGRA